MCDYEDEIDTICRKCGKEIKSDEKRYEECGMIMCGSCAIDFIMGK